jgi:hypothetical protein
VQSFFKRSHGYLEVSDWYEKPEFLGLNLLTKVRERKSKCENLLAALAVAAEMGSMLEAGGRAAGLAAYNTWAQDMLHDEDFSVAHDQMPWSNVQGEELGKRLERPNREHLAQVMLECKGYYARAIAEIGKALQS